MGEGSAQIGLSVVQKRAWSEVIDQADYRYCRCVFHPFLGHVCTLFGQEWSLDKPFSRNSLSYPNAVTNSWLAVRTAHLLEERRGGRVVAGVVEGFDFGVPFHVRLAGEDEDFEFFRGQFGGGKLAQDKATTAESTTADFMA
jgi:hypothetical protein